MWQMLIIYCCVSTLVQAIQYMQNALIVVQSTPLKMKLHLKPDQTKPMLFTNSRNRPQNPFGGYP